jgi:uncharacterized membrane protein
MLAVSQQQHSPIKSKNKLPARRGKTLMERNPRSTVAIAGHPLHPILVTLPIGFLIGAFLSDLAFYWANDPFWVRASLWLIGAGLLTGILAALAGLIDFLSNSAIRILTEAWLHFGGNAVVLILAGISFYIRLYGDTGAVSMTQLLLSLCIVALLGITGWLGGEMVFRRRVAVLEEEREPPK